MSEAQSKRPRQITSLAILWVIFGLWNLWIAFQGISGDLEVWDMLPSLIPQARMAIPVELGLNVVLLVAALIQLLTVPLLLTGHPSSVKLAFGAFISIAVLNLAAGSLYASAPPEIRSDLTSDILQDFGLGIFQMIIVVFFWRDLNRPEVESFLRHTKLKDAPQEKSQGFFKNCVDCGQQIPVASEMCPFCSADQKIVTQSHEKKPDAEPKFYCRYCGSENKRDALYCDSCGKRLKES